jgi:hypothetical protein
MTELFNVAAGFLTNPVGLGIALTAAFCAFRGVDTKEKVFSNILFGLLSTVALCSLFPAVFGVQGAMLAGQQAFTGIVDGPWGDVLNPIIHHESGGVWNVLNGGGKFAADATIAQIAATGKAAGLGQTVPTTMTNLAIQSGVPLTSTYPPSTQIGFLKKLLIEKGMLNPAVPHEAVANGVGDLFCVAAKSNGLPAAACQNAVAPISYAQNLHNVTTPSAFRQSRAGRNTLIF